MRNLKIQSQIDFSNVTSGNLNKLMFGSVTIANALRAQMLSDVFGEKRAALLYAVSVEVQVLRTTSN